MKVKKKTTVILFQFISIIETHLYYVYFAMVSRQIYPLFLHNAQRIDYINHNGQRKKGRFALLVLPLCNELQSFEYVMPDVMLDVTEPQRQNLLVFQTLFPLEYLFFPRLATDELPTRTNFLLQSQRISILQYIMPAASKKIEMKTQK